MRSTTGTLVPLDDTILKAAYYTRKQLCDTFGCSIDPDAPRYSYGRVLDEGEPETAAAPKNADPQQTPSVSSIAPSAAEEVDDEAAAEKTATKEAQGFVQALIDSSVLRSGLGKSVGGGTSAAVAAARGDDVELQALQLLPRSTLEVLLLHALDGARQKPPTPSSQADSGSSSQGGKGVGVSLFGSNFGADFDALIEALQKRKALQERVQSQTHQGSAAVSGAGVSSNGSVAPAAPNGVSLTVRRVNRDQQITAPTSVKPGDIAIFRNGQICPFDGILLDCTKVWSGVSPTSDQFGTPLEGKSSHASVAGLGSDYGYLAATKGKCGFNKVLSISTTYITGTSRRFLRFPGTATDCPYFGATNVIPAGSTLHIDLGSEAVVLAVHTNESTSLSLVERQSRAVPLSIGKFYPMDLPSCLTPAFRLNSRHACARVASVSLFGLDADGVIFDDETLVVASIVIEGCRFRTPSLDAVWNCNASLTRLFTPGLDDTQNSSLNQSGETSSLLNRSRLSNSAVSRLLPGSTSRLPPYGLSPVSLLSEGFGSRIHAVSPAQVCRKVVFLAKLATLETKTEHPHSQPPGVSPWTDSQASQALRTWLNSGQEEILRYLQEEVSHYRPVSERIEVPATIVSSAMRLAKHKPSGKPLYAQLWEYDQPLAGAKQRGALLLLWGDGADVFSLSTMQYDGRGQAPIPEGGVQKFVRAGEVDDTVETIGFATADLPPTAVLRPTRSETVPIADVLALLATRQGTVFVGSVALAPFVDKENLDALLQASTKATAGERMGRGTPAGEPEPLFSSGFVFTAQPTRVVAGMLRHALGLGDRELPAAEVLNASRRSFVALNPLSATLATLPQETAICATVTEAIEALASARAQKQHKCIWLCGVPSRDTFLPELRRALPSGEVIGFLASTLLSATTFRQSDVPLACQFRDTSTTDAYHSPVITEGAELTVTGRRCGSSSAGVGPGDGVSTPGIKLAELFEVIREGKLRRT
jgi:hypothetical protein